ncbi:MAG: SIS domain-containing protein [Spirochaetia bacterium]|nr:SIS domain-containing protein [Spirochaetia bacterium]
MNTEEIFSRYPILEPMQEVLGAAFALLKTAAEQRRLIMVAGNGGSCSDAEHIVGELMKSFVSKRPLSKVMVAQLIATDAERGAYIASHLEEAFPAICLSSHTALSTAFSNDVDASLVYAQQVIGYGKPKDVFWGLSTSGNAKNVVNAAIAAKAKGMHVLGMTGAEGGLLKQYCDVCLCVPERQTYKVQELHLPLYHWLCLEIEREFYGK